MRTWIKWVSAMALAAAPPAAARPADAIAMFRGDLAHSGVYAGAGPVHAPGVKWRVNTGGRLISSPVVKDGTVYVGNTDGKLSALDAATGAERWAFKTEARIASTPAVSGSDVYFSSYDDFFYALDAKSGKLKWKFKTGGERRYAATHLHGHIPAAERMPDPFDVYLSSPAIWNGRVYFGSGDGNVYALDSGTGRLSWKYKTGDVVHSSAAIAEGTVYIGGWDTYFYALDARTGKLRWRLKTGDDPEIHNQIGVQSSPAIANGIVYFGCRDNYLYAVNAHSGKRLWRVGNDQSWVNTSPAVDRGRVYYATADTGTVNALDAKTGAKLASNALSKWYFFSSPALAGDMLYIGSWDGFLYALKRDDLSVVWSFQTEASKRVRPEFMLTSDKKRFYLEGADNGGGFYDDLVRSVYRQFDMGTFLSSPSVSDGILYIGSTDGYLYALQ